MATKRKYATLEEARAANGCATKARWKDPVLGAQWRNEVRQNVQKARDTRTRLTAELKAKMFAEFSERDPSGERLFRYSGKQIAKRYRISVGYLHWLACRHGIGRRAIYRKRERAEA